MGKYTRAIWQKDSAGLFVAIAYDPQSDLFVCKDCGEVMAPVAGLHDAVRCLGCGHAAQVVPEVEVKAVLIREEHLLSLLAQSIRSLPF